ncbi:ribose 5-phosphate isomerase A [Halobacteria archaeon AArc-curdl1]|uniref:Ribose-5-phosphate isomerase A n=1 Tax=Natronosalvus hydrolyticus TaxID=2979988 RepID=A0AAP3E9J6_9EURY|nr:ribose 5-phosphate isomerase A [Halobacteria archaeon AArc-curdl1]
MCAKTTGGSEEAKRRAGERAAKAVEDGMVVGLGTGSTTAYAIEAIGRAVADGLEVQGVPTSFQSRQLALEWEIPLTELDAVSGVDLAIDGADQVVDTAEQVVETGDDTGEPASEHAGTDGDLIKGGGGAHTREKLIASAADRFLVVADPSKCTPVLERPVPVEVIPAAHSVVADRVRDLGGEPTLRLASHKDGPVVTDNGNFVLDCAFGPMGDPKPLDGALASTPGVLEHGLFLEMADIVYIGTEEGVDVRQY